MNWTFVPRLLIGTRLGLGVAILALGFVPLGASGVVQAVALGLGVLTDVFDGVAARRLGVATEGLRRLDSRVDVTFFVTSWAGLVALRPELTPWLVLLGAVLGVLELSVHAVSFVRFRRESSTHHYLSKFFSLLLFGLLAQLFVLPTVTWFFWVTLGVGVVSFVEAGLIMLTVPEWRTDVRSLYDVLRPRLAVPAQANFDQKAAQWDQKDYRVQRAQAVAKAIVDRVGACARGRVLDFGCGTGLLGFHFLTDAASVSFADTSQGMLDQVAAKLCGAPGRGETINLLSQPFSGPYDLIVSLMTLHHIADVPDAIEKLAAALSHGGCLCLADLDHEDGSFHTDEVVPHTGFDRVVIQSALEAAGLHVVSSTTPYVNRKLIEGQDRLYPVFLMVARAQGMAK